MTLPTHSIKNMLSFSPSPQQIKTLPTLGWNVSFLRFETEINGIASFPKKNVVIIYMHCGLFQKKSKEWGHGISRGIEEHIEIAGITQKRVPFSPNQKTIMWNFHGSWFLLLEFSRVLVQFCEISWGEALFSPEFPRIKWQT